MASASQPPHQPGKLMGEADGSASHQSMAQIYSKLGLL
jgi:hypothetical protein